MLDSFQAPSSGGSIHLVGGFINRTSTITRSLGALTSTLFFDSVDVGHEGDLKIVCRCFAFQAPSSGGSIHLAGGFNAARLIWAPHRACGLHTPMCRHSLPLYQDQLRQTFEQQHSPARRRRVIPHRP